MTGAVAMIAVAPHILVPTVIRVVNLLGRLINRLLILVNVIINKMDGPTINKLSLPYTIISLRPILIPIRMIPNLKISFVENLRPLSRLFGKFNLLPIAIPIIIAITTDDIGLLVKPKS